MSRPRLLLIPIFSELTWAIKPELEEWAEVASFDPPGVGSEPLPPGLDLVSTSLSELHEAIARRGLEEADARGWDRFVVVADSQFLRPGVLVAKMRREAVDGLGLGHACLSRAMEGDRAPMNRAVYEAMGQFLRQDHKEFITHGLVQMTRGSFDRDIAEQIIERMPEDRMSAVWDLIQSDPAPIGGLLAELDLPLLLVRHVDCLGSSEEGFEDIVAAFPEARTARVKETPGGSAEFAEELRLFCEQIGAGSS